MRLTVYPKSGIIPGDEWLEKDNIGLKWRFIKIGGSKISGIRAFGKITFRYRQFCNATLIRNSTPAAILHTL